MIASDAKDHAVCTPLHHYFWSFITLYSHTTFHPRLTPTRTPQDPLIHPCCSPPCPISFPSPTLSLFFRHGPRSNRTSYRSHPHDINMSGGEPTEAAPTRPPRTHPHALAVDYSQVGSLQQSTIINLFS